MRCAACCAASVIVLLVAAVPAAVGSSSELAPSGTPGSLPTGLAGTPLRSDEVRRPAREDVAPAGRRLSPARAGRIADGLALVRRERRRYPGATREVLLKGPSRWQVSYFAKVAVGDPRKEVAQVIVDDRSGAVLEQYSDYKVAWTMARGYPGAFGRVVNSPIVWIPLALDRKSVV